MTRFFLLAVLLIAALGACTKAVRVVEPRDYDTALADTTLTFQIQTRDGRQFISKKATVEGDSVLIVKKGHQVQTDEWRQETLARVPIRIPVRNVELVSQIEIKNQEGVAFAVFLGALLIILLSSGGSWYYD